MMRFDSRNLLIAVMFLFIIALMALVYKVNRVVIERVPEHISPKVYVMGLTKAIDRQNRAVNDLAFQSRWLRLHLDKCLSLIESERGLEPISIKFDTLKNPSVGMVFQGDRKGPFVEPFVKYVPSTDDSEREEKHLNMLTCLTNLATLNAQMGSLYGTDEIIANFQQRLERIAPDPNEL